MELKSFCGTMGLSDEARGLLAPKWTEILEHWNGGLPDFLSGVFIEKYLPMIESPDEREILRRADDVIALCRKEPAAALYMHVLHYGVFTLKITASSLLATSFFGENSGIAYLLAALSSAPLIEANCRKRGIPVSYAHDALQWIGGTVAIYKLAHDGIPGHTPGQLYWMHHHADGELYRIGRFEYLLHRLPVWAPLVFRNNAGKLAVLTAPDIKLDSSGLAVTKGEAVTSFIEEDGPFVTGIPVTPEGFAKVGERLTVDRREFSPVCAPWDLVPSIHIPGGLRMKWEDALDSMKQAKAFFKKYYRREIPMIVCGSWILNPALEKFAPEGNMARFRRELFCAPMIRWSDQGRDGMFFAFGRDDVDPTEIPPVNSIQRVLQEIFRSEGTLRTGAMFVLTEDLDKLGNAYYRASQELL